MSQPYGAKLLSSLSLLGLSMACVTATSILNISSGLRICAEAGIVMAVASLGPPIVSAFTQLHGRSLSTAAAMGLCCIVSVWCELHAWTDSQATLLASTETALNIRENAQGQIDWARQRVRSIDEPLNEGDLSIMVADAESDVKKAEASAAKAVESAEELGVTCDKRASCRDAARVLQTTKDALKNLRERLGRAKEKARLLAQAEANVAPAGSGERMAGVLPGMVAQATGWSQELTKRGDHLTFTVLMVALNLTFSILGGRAFEGVAQALAMKRGYSWEPPAEPLVETRAVRPPTDAELLVLAQRHDLRTIESQYAGVPGCSRSSLNRRLLTLRSGQ